MFPTNLFCLATSLFGASAFEAIPDGEAIPLERLFAHNDQEKGDPLNWVAGLGFCHIEADASFDYLQKKIVIGHDCDPIFAPCYDTLEDFYVKPLAEMYRSNGGIYRRGGKLRLCEQVTFLVDVKSSAQHFFDVLDPLIRSYEEQYPGLFTKYAFGDTVIAQGAVTVLLSGNRVSLDYLASQSERFVVYDGRIPEDLNDLWGKEMIPWISQNWRALFNSTDVPFSQETRAEIKLIVEKAHNQGQLVRFWNTPQDPAFWEELIANDVDLLNIDDYDLAYGFMWD